MIKIYDDNQLRIVLAGDSDIGKTCLLIRYCDDRFEEYPYLSMGVNYRDKTVKIDGLQIKLIIWDTPGKERMRHISKGYFHSSHGILFLFDASSPIEDFKTSVRTWINIYKDSVNENLIPAIIVGNKIDKDNIIPKDEAEEFAAEMGFPYFEISVKQNKGIDDAFDYLFKAAYHYRLRKELKK